eukprot:TRINITY_DN6902_c0_g1_i4.p1 TRINITY_DN6902_c0_g1~~TRINITY_DN6902_c0_g1_i4.p1  ORF type:complete len:701 (+),score=138.44 TRINITY_DN6902_c0_g1_i4:82-2184(+)
MQIIYVVLIFIVLSASSQIVDQPQIMLTNFEGRLKEVVWCGEDTFVLRTEYNKVYRGSNKGTIYKKLAKSVPDEMGEVVEIVKSKANFGLLFFVGVKGKAWITMNCGDSVVKSNNDFKIDKVQLHPTMSDWILALMATKNGYTLQLSQDLGVHWRRIAENIVKVEWPFNKEQIAAGLNVSKLYALGTSGQLIESEDFFMTRKVLAEGVEDFVVSETYLIAIKRSELLVGNIYELFGSLYSSTFSSGSHLRILDTSENKVFVLVMENAEAPLGDVYSSDSQGIRFELAKHNCIYNSQAGADFLKLEGIEGAYVANTLSDKAAAEYRRFREEELEDAMESRKSKITALLLQNNIRTSISYNRGKDWSYLVPPKDKPNSCFSYEECGLHLFLRMYTEVPLSVHRSRPGTIVGSGNVGRALFAKSRERKVYLSADGGASWKEVADGEHLLGVSDGGITVIAQPGTSSIKYSLDGGTKWTKKVMSERDRSILKIFTEPNANLQYFLIQTQQSDDTGHSLFSLDFSSLFTRKCTSADFLHWQPHSNCILGRNITYIRKKPSSQCYAEVQTPVASNCLCTEEDYECDRGFVRKNGTCVALGNDTIPPCSSGKVYVRPSGYRKVKGDTCEGGMDYGPVVIECRQAISASANWWMIALIGVFGILALVVRYLFARVLKEKSVKSEFRKVKHEIGDAQAEDEQALNIEGA